MGCVLPEASHKITASPSQRTRHSQKSQWDRGGTEGGKKGRRREGERKKEGGREKMGHSGMVVSQPLSLGKGGPD